MNETEFTPEEMAAFKEQARRMIRRVEGMRRARALLREEAVLETPSSFGTERFEQFDDPIIFALSDELQTLLHRLMKAREGMLGRELHAAEVRRTVGAEVYDAMRLKSVRACNVAQFEALAEFVLEVVIPALVGERAGDLLDAVPDELHRGSEVSHLARLCHALGLDREICSLPSVLEGVEDELPAASNHESSPVGSGPEAGTSDTPTLTVPETADTTPGVGDAAVPVADAGPAAPSNTRGCAA